jgi:hypothetical protein
MRQDVPHVLHQTLHTLPRPLKMKQNSGDARLAATPHNPPPPAPGARLLGDAWETEKPLRGPRYGSSNQGVEHGLQRPGPARQSADALDKDLTNSERQGMWADAGESGSAHGKPVRSKLIASTSPRAQASTSHREKTAECRRWRLSCGSGPRRDALKTLCLPAQPPTAALACVFTRDGSCVGTPGPL